MKAMTNGEFEQMVGALTQSVGARLQAISEKGQQLTLNFWQGDLGLRSWLLDLNPARPVLLPLAEGKNLKGSVKKSPTLLFLKAHFEGRTLTSVEWSSKWGRVLNLWFSEDRRVELRLYTGGANLLAHSQGKQIAYRKPKDLKPLDWEKDLGEARSFAEIYQALYFGQKNRSEVTKGPSGEEKEKAKLEKALKKLETDIENKKNQDWEALGHHLMETQGQNVPEKWKAFIDPKLSYLENSQRAFAKAKQIKVKLMRSEERRQELVRQISLPTSALTLGGPKTQPKPLTRSFKGRTLRLSSGHQFLIGKSAADNLKLLRAASPWDYWMHLKDFPGAHGILRRHRNETISLEIQKEAARLLAKEHLKNRWGDHESESFDVLVAETRYVRPIKGDRLGRVTCTRAQVLRT